MTIYGECTWHVRRAEPLIFSQVIKDVLHRVDELIDENRAADESMHQRI